MTELRICDEPLPGVFLLDCPYYPDVRGDFTKLFHSEALQNLGIDFTPVESFLTRSKENVVRGMHYQIGISSHDKLVSCIKGKVIDVVVDIRPGSKSFNKPEALELSESCNKALLISKGYAHGFLTIEDDSWMLYSTTTVHCPSLDRGVRWDSIDFDWPTEKPIISTRDECHPHIQDLL